ncbi:MAG: N-acetylneuraminate synthase family protein [Lachnospiraceae bacterium]|nr:N-acetylneuraminate synthase family protein [Lachnospiraceae bacterium]
MSKLFDDLIIFEMANNHQGDVEHGKAIIKELGDVTRKYNINAAVKFQYRDLDTMIHPDYVGRSDVKHIPRFLSTRLTGDEFLEMVECVKANGMHTMCTPFDEKSVDLIMDHGIEIIKVASCSAIDWPLLEEIAVTKKPVIISTGGKDFAQIDNIYNFMSHRDVDFAMLHCVGLYPVGDKYLQLNCLDKMIKRYPDITIGYSGHENPDDYTIAHMAIAKGAKILERHVGKATDEIKLNAYSTDVKNVHLWIEEILRARIICGDVNKKYISPEEIQSMNELARGCYAASPINRGEVITRDKVFFAMPCVGQQTTSGQYQESMTASKDYAVNEPIFEKIPVSATNSLRGVIHDVKGMLYEAKIVIPKEFDLEISHHYGVEHFRHYGCTIINIINREYCKKILIVLPGQINPTHTHKIKEETFQVLYGSLELTIEDRTVHLGVGEIFTVERYMAHSFTSVDGCVFEEISSTHARKDSYYADPKIQSMDPMERKTILKDW